MPDVTISIASPEDAPEVTRMLGQLAADLGDAGHFHSTPEAVARHMGGPRPLVGALIARRGGTGLDGGPAGAPAGGPALGLSFFFPHFSTLRGQPGVYVQDLWVDAATRGTGLGARLLAATARHARADWGAAYLMLTVYRSNAAARRFYDRLGFAPHSADCPMSLSGAGFARLADTVQEAPA